MDKRRGSLIRWVVQLQRIREYPDDFPTIAQFDHNPMSEHGHDVFSEGLHIDLYLQDDKDVKIYPSHPPLHHYDTGAVPRRCTDYFKENTEWFLDAHRGAITPNDPPSW